MAYNVPNDAFQQGSSKMTAVVGWLIIVTALISFSMLLLWPGFRLVRRSHPGSKAVFWSYLASAAACSVTLWYLIPLAVHDIFAKTVH
jgi:magnesium-transporting ATPase (P-type)